jgi:hypothetical protein
MAKKKPSRGCGRRQGVLTGTVGKRDKDEGPVSQKSGDSETFADVR